MGQQRQPLPALQCPASVSPCCWAWANVCDDAGIAEIAEEAEAKSEKGQGKGNFPSII